MNLAERLYQFLCDRELHEIDGGSIIITIDGDILHIRVDPNGNRDDVRIEQ
jgi:hypothetical protein